MNSERSDNLRGMAMMALAVGLLSLMDMGLKLLSPHYPPLQVGALRGLASWPLIVVWIGLSTGFRPLFKVRWPLHLLRGALGIFMMAAFVYAVRSLPLTTAYTLFFISPLVITALSGPLLGETVGLKRWLAILAGFSGVLIALRPTGDGVFSWAGLCVLLAASAYALSAITVRVLSRTDSTQSVMFWVISAMAFGSALLAAPDWVAISREHYALIAAIGVLGALGQYAITEAFSRGEASAVAPLEYTALAWALGFDVLSGDGWPSTMLWLSCGVIVCSGLWLMRLEQQKAPKRIAVLEADLGT